eukprot:m.94853 g.94853  ORF g.94853 m.94853 type:complete len:73 (+) comp16573_c0_seq1:177-395(+)
MTALHLMVIRLVLCMCLPRGRDGAKQGPWVHLEGTDNDPDPDPACRITKPCAGVLLTHTCSGAGHDAACDVY